MTDPKTWRIHGNEIVDDEGSICEVNNPVNASFILHAAKLNQELFGVLREIIFNGQTMIIPHPMECGCITWKHEKCDLGKL